MKFEQALTSFVSLPPKTFLQANEANAPMVESVRQFLKGGAGAGAKGSFFEHPLLQGNGFKFVSCGTRAFVIGNDKVVVKIGESPESYAKVEPPYCRYPSIPISDIPQGLAAEVMQNGEGSINGAPYLICERLITKDPVSFKEMISHLFKCRSEGVAYPDAHADNFAHNARGEVRIIDHSHFKKFNATLFAESIESAEMFGNKNYRFPIVFSDDVNTYIVAGSKVWPASTDVPKHIRTILQAVGINPDVVDAVGTNLFFVPQTQVSIGRPPREQLLETYLGKGLKSIDGHHSKQKGLFSTWMKSKF